MDSRGDLLDKLASLPEATFEELVVRLGVRAGVLLVKGSPGTGRVGSVRRSGVESQHGAGS